MQILREGIAIVLVISGVFFFLVSTIGLLRLPDVYTRLHATSKGDTLGAGLCLLGAMFYLGFSLTSFKLFLIIVFVWVTSPTASHLIGKSAYRGKVKPACEEFVILDVTEKAQKERRS